MWLESHAELRDHPKVDLLMDLLQTTRRDVVGLLHFVWWRALTYSPSGDLSDFTDGQIARWADWDGDPGHLVSALKTAGFMDSQRTLHDWDEYAGRYIDRRSAEAARKRSARRAAAGRVNGATSGASAGHPEDVPPDVLAGARAEYLTGPDRTLTGPDTTTTIPQPLPPAEGERKPTRRRSTGNGEIRGEAADAAPPPEVPLSPLAPADCQLWRSALDRLPSMTAGNREQVTQLEPLGRAPDGGLMLRAPPGHRLARFRPQIARALADAGDAHGTHVHVIER